MFEVPIWNFKKRERNMAATYQDQTGKQEIVPLVTNIKDIGSLIYTIRGVQVMLDYDLATLYGYEVRRLNEQVKRNIGRFPADFMFQLTKEEVNLVKSQFATSPDSSFYSGQEGGRKKPPYAFTEQGEQRDGPLFSCAAALIYFSESTHEI